jgi:hypothetical protein
MQMESLTKLIVCVLVVVGAVILAIMKALPSEVTSMLLSGALGYVFGNGHGILSAIKQQPELIQGAEDNAK